MAAVTFKRPDDVEVPGFLVGKEGNGIGIVCIQEWWGVNDEIKRHAQLISESLGGAQVLIPDLYRGKVALEVAEANHLMDGLDWPGSITDIQGATNFLREQKGCKKIGIIGFCMGGALSLAGAARATGIDAAVCFYGIPPEALADPATIKIPLMCHFGSLDTHAGFSDPAAADALEKKLKDAKVAVEFHRYPKGGHGFLNRPSEWYDKKREEMKTPPFDEETCQTAWNRTQEFFKKHLAA